MRWLALALMLVAGHAHAVIGISEPWPHAPLPCAPADAIFGPGTPADPTVINPFTALKNAINFAVANKGADGIATVRFVPGTTVMHNAESSVWSVNAKQSTVELCGDNGIASFTMPDGDYRFSLLGLRGVRVTNMSFDRVWPGLFTARDFIELNNTNISNTLQECVSWGSGPDMSGGGSNIDPTAWSYALFYKSRLVNCGLNDGDGHAIYMSRRGCGFYAIENEMHSQTTLEGYRSLCRFGFWANNDISNTGKAPVRGGQGNPIDTPSCGAHVFKRNKIHAEGDNAAVGIRARRSITGCDMPNNREQANTGIAGDREPFFVRDPSFWSSVRAKPFPLTSSDPAALLTNPQLFPVLLWDNELTATGNVKQPAVLLYSTFANDKVGNGSEYLRTPLNWTERSWALMVGLKPTGFVRTWTATRNTAIAPETLPDVKDYVRDVLDVTEKVKYFEMASPPANWMPDTNDPRTICEYFAAHSRWLDEPDGEGFPRCDLLPGGVTPPPTDVPAPTLLMLSE